MIRLSCVTACRLAMAAGLSAMILLAAGGAAQAPPMGPMQPDAGPWAQPQPMPAGPSAQDEAIEAARRAHEDPLRAHASDRQKSLLEGIERLKRDQPTETPVEESTKISEAPATPSKTVATPAAVTPPTEATAVAKQVENPAPPTVTAPPPAEPPAIATEEPNKPVTPDNLIRTALISLVAIGVLVALGGLLIARRKPEDEPTTNDDDTPEDGYGIPIDSHAPWHHCQGHRLGIVIGPESDRSLKGAMVWLGSKANVQHKIHISAGSVDKKPPDFREVSKINADGRAELYTGPPPPPPPPPKKGEKSPPKPAPPKPVPPEQRLDSYFDAECGCCCHWDEVIIVAHGGQQYLWHALLNHLPQMLNNRPAKKVVLWICSTAGEFFPNNPIKVEKDHLQTLDNQPVFEQIAWLLRPKSCHVDERCGCDVNNCGSRDADGHRGGKCPDGKQPVTMICGGWYGDRIDEDDDGKNVPISAALGIDVQKDVKTGELKWHLTSPDGKIRTVHIAPSPAGGGEDQDGNAVTTDKPSDPGDILGGTELAPDSGLKNSNPSNLDKIGTKKRLAPTTTKKPPQNVVAHYAGGRHCNHKEREGCQSDPI